MGKSRAFYERHKQLILYMLFGILTCAISLAACYVTLKLGVRVMHDENGQPTELLDILGSTAQWVFGVIVTFFTNRKWVFTEHSSGAKNAMTQFAKFSGGRVCTYFIEVAFNLGAIVGLEYLGYKPFTFLGIAITVRVWAKLLSSVVIIVSNYFISKLLVFRK